MYKKVSPISLKTTASIIPRNLSLINNQDVRTYAVISRNLINLTTIDETGSQMNQKQVIPKIARDGVSVASGASNENAISPVLTQAKYVTVANRVILVVCSTKGIFFYEEDGVNIIYFHNLRNIRPTPIEETVYARGISVLKPNIIAIGTCVSSILLFEVASKGNNINLVNEIIERNLKSGVTDLASHGDLLFASDTNGNILGWNVSSASNPNLIFSIRGSSNSCSCLGLMSTYLIAAFSNGTISVYDIENGQILATICAHARSTNCLDTNEDKFASTGEDGFIRIWQLNDLNGKVKVSMIQAERLEDCLATGLVFDKKSDEICVSIFDNNEILVFKSQ